MARPPQPLPLKMLKGRGGGRDSRGYAIPTAPAFEHEPPEPPDWLSEEALALWRRLAPALDRLDVLKDEDREAFTAYCETWATYVKALRLVRSHGLTCKHPQTGQHKNPAVGIVETAGGQLMRFAREFGLTPAAEVALAKPPKAISGDDPFAAPAGQA